MIKIFKELKIDYPVIHFESYDLSSQKGAVEFFNRPVSNAAIKKLGLNLMISKSFIIKIREISYIVETNNDSFRFKASSTETKARKEKVKILTQS